MKCTKCEGLGWVETFIGTGARFTPSLSQCPERCNITGYSGEVMRRLNDPKYKTPTPVLAPQQAPSRCSVLQFRRKPPQ